MYIWGKVQDTWHALARHDPEYRFMERVSESLTRQARKHNPDAPEVRVRVPARDETGKRLPDGPGTGFTMCDPKGTTRVSLEQIGIDPNVDDQLCPACKVAIEVQ